MVCLASLPAGMTFLCQISLHIAPGASAEEAERAGQAAEKAEQKASSAAARVITRVFSYSARENPARSCLARFDSH